MGIWAFILSAPCWPALVNGQPFFTLDTIAYLHAAAHGVSRLLGIEAIWYAPVAAAGDVGQALPGTQPESHATGSVVLMGRSAPTHDFRSSSPTSHMGATSGGRWQRRSQNLTSPDCKLRRPPGKLFHCKPAITCFFLLSVHPASFSSPSFSRIEVRR